MKRARVIYNPTSGKELIRKHLADILEVLEKAGYEASAFATTALPFSARDEASRAGRAGFDLVVAAGGDGTINEVVNVKAAAEVILKEQTIKMDIGKTDRDYFINIAAGGHLTELTYDVPSELKSVFGYLAYLAKGAELLPRVKPIKMHFKYDDGEYIGGASMFFLGLTNSVGGFEQIAPDAKLDDGKFSLIIVKTANIFEIVHLIALMMNGGKHINDRRLIYTKTSRLEVDAPDAKDRLMINLDGEYGGDAPMIFTNLHNHIEFFANLDQIPDDAVVGESYEELSQGFIKEVERLSDEDINGDGFIGEKQKQ